MFFLIDYKALIIILLLLIGDVDSKTMNMGNSNCDDGINEKFSTNETSNGILGKKKHCKRRHR